MLLATDDFRGNERYVAVRRLGAGGMGIVYRAYDRERGVPVALKTLRTLDAVSLYRFKQEFRALADVVHPNLVTLYELVSTDGDWFFTMELIDGDGFIAHVRPGTQVLDLDRDGDAPTMPTSANPPSLRELQAAAPLKLALLRPALLQLVDGVGALHAAGKLHRDIKPTNVLVDRGGRVKLLDFGLVAEAEPSAQPSSSEPQLVGTAAYMAPEQAAMGALSAASDWYSVGAMLYEALTGRVPFLGSPMQMLLDKQSLQPPAPADLCPDVPADLNALCVDLLRRAPERRPSEEEIRARLLGTAAPYEPATPLPLGASELPRSGVRASFVGREAALKELAAAFDLTQQGRGCVMLVEGSSGIGKTALVRRFLKGLPSSAVVLSGRCYEQESVPYKALDSLVDALCRYLLGLSNAEVEACLPRDALALARIFPVLRRVREIADGPRTSDQADPQELRRRAFAALRELFARVTDRHPLVLFIDDLQWGDADSAALLAELLRPPDAPPLLLITSFRSEDAAAVEPLRAQLAQRPGAPLQGAVQVRELTLPPLSEEDARALARSQLEDPSRAELLARESGGSPLLVEVLVRHAREVAAGPAPAPLTLERALQERIAHLSEEDRCALELVAVAGRPLPLAALQGAAPPQLDVRARVASLRALRLLRATPLLDTEGWVAYHDRIRELVVRRLEPAARAQLHLRLGESLEAGTRPDPEALALHFKEAGDARRAARYAKAAAERAAGALAFDRAAALYAEALALQPPDGAERVSLGISVADALAHAGRGAEAAGAYLAVVSAAQSAPGPKLRAAETLELQRRAAEQLLRSGHIDQGLAALGTVLSAVGMHLPSTPMTALLTLARRRLRLSLRGLDFVRRDETQVSAEELTRVDVCWTGAVGLAMVDPIRGASFQTKHLLLALAAGEPVRIARALAAEAAFVGTAGARNHARAVALVQRARALAEETGNPQTRALTRFVEGLTAFLVGQFGKARALADEAEQIFRDLARGVAWEAASAQLICLWSLFYLGDVAELCRRVPRLSAQAQERGDLYAVTSLRSGLSNVSLLVADEPHAAIAEVERSMREWSNQGFQFQHYWAALARTMVDLYLGDGAAAQQRVEALWPDLKASLLLRIQNVRIEAVHLKARCALAAAQDASGARRAQLLRSARRDAKALRAERMPWATAVAALVSAGAAQVEGQQALALQLLAEGVTLADAAQLHLFAAAGRTRLAGARESGEIWMRAQGILAPQRMSRMLVPGF